MRAQTWKKLDGPVGGKISHICGFDSIIAVVLNRSSVFVSRDTGNAWQLSYEMEGLSITSLDFIDNKLYIGTNRKVWDSKTAWWKIESSIYISTDYGANWKMLHAIDDTVITNLWVIEKIIKFNNVLYAATDNGVYISSNEGINWEPKNNGFPNPPPGNTVPIQGSGSVKVLAANDSTLFAATSYWVYVSRDSGNSWLTVDSTLVKNFFTIAVKDTVIFAGTSIYPDGVYKSLNNGETWKYVSNFPGSGYINQIAFLQNRVFVATWMGEVLASDNYGVDWFNVSNGLKGNSPEALSVINQTLYLGTDGAGIYKWSESDKSWQQNQNLKSAYISGLTKSNGNIYATTIGNGVWKTDSYNNWYPVNNGLKTPLAGNVEVYLNYINGIASLDSNLWIGAGEILGDRSGGFYYANSNDDIWMGISAFGNTGSPQAIDSIVFVSSDIGNKLSKDYGYTWDTLSSIGLPEFSYSFSIYDTFFTIGYEYIIDSSGWKNKQDDEIFMSSDLGNSWTNITGNLPISTSSYKRSLGRIYKMNHLLFTSCWIYDKPEETGVYVSSDVGNSWKKVSNGLPYGAISDNYTHYDSLLFISTELDKSYTGIFYTINYGEKWYPLDTIMHYDISALLIDTPYLYAGTSGYGLWRIEIPKRFHTKASFSQTACNSYTSPSTKYVWTKSGTYLDTLTNSTGFDSIITVNLTINIVDTSVTLDSISLTASADSATYQWLICDSIFIPISGENEKTFTAVANGNYAVTITQNGCTDTSSCYNVTGLGIDESGYSNSIIVYPNPFTESTTFYFGNTPKVTTVTIYNQLGFVIQRKKLFKETSFTFQRKEIPSGIYFYKIEDAGAYIASGKLVVF